MIVDGGAEGSGEDGGAASGGGNSEEGGMTQSTQTSNNSKFPLLPNLEVPPPLPVSLTLQYHSYPYYIILST